jgi:threonine dehydratase
MTTLNARPTPTASHRVLDAIGNTPLVTLHSVVPRGSARIVAKLESANPTGSMKDRMARALVERASSDGRLPYDRGRLGAAVREHRCLSIDNSRN